VDRVHTEVARIANKMKAAGKDKVKQEELFNRYQNDLINVATAHAELIMWEAFTSALKTINHDDTRQLLTWLRDLYGFTLLEKNLDWFMINGRLTSQRAEAITDYIDDRLLPRLKPYASDLVDAFELTEPLIRSSLAFGAEQKRRDSTKESMVDA
jgi:acyl-CoA oxidase